MFDYSVHMVSFRNEKHSGAYNVLKGDGGNLQEWHIEELERFVERMKEKLHEDLC